MSTEQAFIVVGRRREEQMISPYGTATPLAYATFGAYSKANVVTEGRTFTLQGWVNF